MSARAERPEASGAPAAFAAADRGDRAAIEQLLPAGAAAGAGEIVESLGLRELPVRDPRRPYLLLNMISTADGLAAIGGRSGPLGDAGDRELFHALRGEVDAVMAGAGTVRTERYGRIIRDAGRRRRRLARGLSEEPLACIVSASLSLPSDLPLLAEPAARVVIVTSSSDTMPASAAEVDYVRSERGGQLDLRSALEQLWERFAVRTLLCEGGPHLNLQLLAAGLVEELFLTLSPKLVGGVEASSQVLRILAGSELAKPVELELLGVLKSSSELLLRYRVRAASPASVSREMTSSSSVAS